MTKNTKFYYAMIDRTATKSNPGYGFANTKQALGFYSKKARAMADKGGPFDASTRWVEIESGDADRQLRLVTYASFHSAYTAGEIY